MNVCIWKEVSKLILLEIFWGRRERVLFSTSANQMSSAVVVTPAAFLKRQQWAFQTCRAAAYSQRKAVAVLKSCMGVHNQTTTQETYTGCSILSVKCLWRREHVGDLGLRLWIAVLEFSSVCQKKWLLKSLLVTRSELWGLGGLQDEGLPLLPPMTSSIQTLLGEKTTLSLVREKVSRNAGYL